MPGTPPVHPGCAAPIRHLERGYALDTYPIRIRTRYVVDTYQKSIRKNRDNSDTRADTYWTTIAHYRIHIGPAHLPTIRDGEGSRGGVGRPGQQTAIGRATSARRAAAVMVKRRRGQRPHAAGIDGGACSMPSAAATSASLFRPAGGAAMAQPKAAAPRVLSHPEARPWLGPSEPERERREGERGEEQRERECR
jgi:hypothetical protein